MTRREIRQVLVRCLCLDCAVDGIRPGACLRTGAFRRKSSGGEGQFCREKNSCRHALFLRQSGHLVLSQSLLGPERYGLSIRFDTMPSRLRACAGRQQW